MPSLTRVGESSFSCACPSSLAHLTGAKTLPSACQALMNLLEHAYNNNNKDNLCPLSV